MVLVIKRLTISWSSRSSVRKNTPYKILAIGNCSAETFGCSIEVLIPWEIMTSSKMIFWFQEIIEVLIERSTLNFLVNLNSTRFLFPEKTRITNRNPTGPILLRHRTRLAEITKRRRTQGIVKRFAFYTNELF